MAVSTRSRRAWLLPLGLVVAGCGTADHVTSGPPGDLELYANAKRCLIIGSYSAVPAVTGVGESVALSATSSESANPHADSFEWLASTGSFGDAQAPATDYTCAAVGIQTVTLVVSDGSCVDFAKLPISCVASH